MTYVVKADGKKELFNEDKLKQSIQRAKISFELQDKALSYIKPKLYDNIPTSTIYSYLAEFLGKSDYPYTKAKYGLKRGIMDLGPTGYPFEDFIGEILKREGYDVQIRSILNGLCVNHEIDLIAEKLSKRFMVEAKFHNDGGSKSNIHVSLYTKARFDDLKANHKLDQAWIITNTKITSDALAYASCSNIKVTSWEYPEGESLRDLIEKLKLHPVTILNSLSIDQKQQLLTNHVVLCSDVNNNPNSLDILHLPDDKKLNVISESKFICAT